MLDTLRKSFIDLYGEDEKTSVFFAPGRINLIGEHIDYNGGYVLPAAISFGTYAIVKKRNDNILKFSSLNFAEEGIIECSLNNLAYNDADKWANYPKGIIATMIEKGYSIPQGLEVLFYGNIPNEAGLSSSASLEMVMGILLKELFHLNVTTKEIVDIAQIVENKYIGVNSGIMDQFSVGFGKKDHAILLNCESLDYEYTPFKLETYAIVIIHTNKKRALSESKYNERHQECNHALRDLQKKVQIDNLCQLTPTQFEDLKHLIKNDINRKRAHHAVYENMRTKEAAQHLKDNDIVSFGKLMNLSHDSLKNYYEVTGIELDTIVRAAQSQAGVLGARMTGAGFGGCAIAIVKRENIELFKENVNNIYTKEIGYPASFYDAELEDGMKEVLIK